MEGRRERASKRVREVRERDRTTEREREREMGETGATAEGRGRAEKDRRRDRQAGEKERGKPGGRTDAIHAIKQDALEVIKVVARANIAPARPCY